ncbi:MAG: NADPH-dependent F420 reductase [Aggregatilineales bacterium]
MQTDLQHTQPITLAVLGGTGKEGSGLAIRWVKSGYRVIIGSRDAERARAKVEEFKTQLNPQAAALLSGAENRAAAEAATIVILSVPYDAHQATLEGVREALHGKIVVDVAVPLLPPKIRTVYVPPGKAAALEAQALLGDQTHVVAAFHNVSAVHLQDTDHPIECDVLICGDDEAAKAEVIRLTEAIGLRGLDAGPLANAVAVEAMTPVLLYLNRRYKVKAAGLVITGLP